MYAGRTEKTQLHPNLTKYLSETLTLQKLNRTFPEMSKHGDHEFKIILFGEGYDPKIQKGKNYREDISFRLFDVYIKDHASAIGGWWLEPENIENIAEKLGIETVPNLIIGNVDIQRIVEYVKSRPISIVSKKEDNPKSEYVTEGIVARSYPLLLRRNGERVIFKLKVKDFA